MESLAVLPDNNMSMRLYCTQPLVLGNGDAITTMTPITHTNARLRFPRRRMTYFITNITRPDPRTSSPMYVPPRLISIEAGL